MKGSMVKKIDVKCLMSQASSPGHLDMINDEMAQWFKETWFREGELRLAVFKFRVRPSLMATGT